MNVSPNLNDTTRGIPKPRGPSSGCDLDCKEELFQTLANRSASPRAHILTTRTSSKMHLLYQRIGGSEGLSRLLRHFYADVRQDPLIGPIFNAQIKDWKHHLAIIGTFWETLIGGPRTYARPMPNKHLPLRLREEHFERWLFLWQANCRAQLPMDVAREMIDIAHHVAQKLRMVLGILK